MLEIYSCYITIGIKLIYRQWLRGCVNLFELHILYCCSSVKMITNTLCIDWLLLMYVTIITDILELLSVIHNWYTVLFILVSQHYQQARLLLKLSTGFW